MAKKSDLEKLQGILEEFDQDTIMKVITDQTSEPAIQKSFKDTDKLGKEVKVGQDCRVELEELSNLERIIEENNLLPVHFLEEGAIVQRAVARVRVPGTGYGTGFLVSPSLLMTNNHVLRTKAAARKAQIQFNYQLNHLGVPQTVDTYTLNPDNFFYTNVALDFTLVRVNSKCIYKPFFPIKPVAMDGNEAIIFSEDDTSSPVASPVNLPITIPQIPDLKFPWLKKVCTNAGNAWGWLRLPRTVSYAKGQHLNIIQHPRARRKEVALQENELDAIFTTRIRYTTDTENGSSGSPVFNNAWDLIALHHAAGKRSNGRWVNNQGIRIDKIAGKLQSQFGGTVAGRRILNELGI